MPPGRVQYGAPFDDVVARGAEEKPSRPNSVFPLRPQILTKGIAAGNGVATRALALLQYQSG